MQQTIPEVQSTQLLPDCPSPFPARTSNPEEEEIRALKEHCVTLLSKVHLIKLRFKNLGDKIMNSGKKTEG